MVGTVFDFLFRPAETDGEAPESARRLVIGVAPADFISLAAREAGDAQRVAQAETLVDLGIDIEFDAVPGADAGEQRRIEGLAAHAAGVEAVWPAERRGEAGVVLINHRRLAVEVVPIGRVPSPGGAWGVGMRGGAKKHGRADGGHDGDEAQLEHGENPILGETVR